MIIVCPNDIKDKYLSLNKLHNYRFYTLNEIKEKIFFKYDDLALYEVTKEYQVKPTIALKMLENLYYIDKYYNNQKLDKLFDLKKHLLSKNLILEDNNFLNMLSDEIIIDGYIKNKELEQLIEVLSKYTKVTYKEFKPKYDLKNIYKFDDIDLEIRFVAENILTLINSGIDINKIHVINSNSEYIGVISRIFSLFKLPYSLNHQKQVTMFKTTKEFLKFIKTSDFKVCELNDFLNELKKFNESDILNTIINVLNKYYKLNDSVKDLYEIIYFELKNTYLRQEKYKNVVNILEGIREFDDDEYVFSISNNETTTYKDNEYLKDNEKKMIGLNSSYELNNINDIKTINVLSNIKNLTLSYKLHSGDNEYVINHIFENLEVKTYEFKNNSLNYNKYLFTNYKMYDNSYKKINYEDLKTYLDNKLNLSYSSMDLFYRCKFRFFLNNILRIEPKEETMATKIGSMFHKILERTLKNDYENYLEIIDEECNNYLNSNIKERFYAENLKKEAIKIIERLKLNSSKSSFKAFAFEKYFELKTDSKMDIKLIGYADKILVFNDGINNYIIVVDYKTGSYSIDLSKIKDGFNMQLLIYLYLVTKTDFIENPKIAGAYIDHILDELKNSEYGKKYEEIVDTRLDGITIKNHEILSHIDEFYDINSYLKGIKVKKDGEFYSYSKVYSERDFDKLLKIVEENINNVIASIEACDFEIDPKRYVGSKPSEIIGCEFCPFKEVCYMSAKDIKMLNKTTVEEILGDENAVDE